MKRASRLVVVMVVAALLYILPEILRELFLGTYGFVGWPTYYHTRIARLIVNEQAFPEYDEQSFGGRPWSYPPGFPSLLAVVAIVNGWEPSLSVIIVPPIIGAVSIALVYAIARRVGVPPLLAAVIFSISPPQVYSASHSMSRILPVFETYALLLLLLCYLRSRRTAYLALSVLCLATTWGSHLAVSLYACILAAGLLYEGGCRRSEALLLFAGSFLLVGFWYVHIYTTLGIPEENAFHQNFGDLTAYFPDLIFELRLTSLSLLVYAASLLAIPILSRSPEGRAVAWWMFVTLVFVMVVGNRENIHLAMPFSLAASVVLRKLPRRLMVPILVLLLYYAWNQTAFMAILPPNTPILDAMRWLGNNTPPDAVVLSEWSKGHWIATVAGRQNVMDFFAEYVDHADEVWWDTRIIFQGDNVTKSMGLLAKYNVSHILIDSPMRQWELWGWEKYGLLSYVNDTEEFNLVYNNTYAQVYEVHNTSPPIEVHIPKLERQQNIFTSLSRVLPVLALVVAGGVWWSGTLSTAALSLLMLLIALPFHIYPIAANVAPLGWDAAFHQRLTSLLGSQANLPVFDPLSTGGRSVGISMGYHLLGALVGLRTVNTTAYLALFPLFYVLARRYLSRPYAVLASGVFLLQFEVLVSSTALHPRILGLALVLAHMRWRNPLMLLAISTIHLPSFLFAIQVSLLSDLVEKWRAVDLFLLILTVPAFLFRLVSFTPLVPLVMVFPFIWIREKRGLVAPLLVALGWLVLLEAGGMVFNDPTWGWTEPWNFYTYKYSYMGVLLGLIALPMVPSQLIALTAYSVVLTKYQFLTYVPNTFSLFPSIPVALMAAIGLRAVFRTVIAPAEPGFGRKVAGALLVFMLYWCARASLNHAINAYPDVTLEDLEALRWVQANATGTVLGSVDISGVWLSTYANRTSYLDAEFLTTPDFVRRENTTKSIFAKDDPYVVRYLLDLEDIDYVYLTAEDPRYIKRGIKNITKKFEQANLTLVYKNDRARIFATAVSAG
ncbi:MAG: hypothetical protein QF415_14590 [Candidatus Undinarchaeales archaeon]|nr:hypothetical protein [Candidatus Undinarchaeales archaeon]